MCSRWPVALNLVSTFTNVNTNDLHNKLALRRAPNGEIESSQLDGNLKDVSNIQRYSA